MARLALLLAAAALLFRWLRPDQWRVFDGLYHRLHPAPRLPLTKDLDETFKWDTR